MDLAAAYGTFVVLVVRESGSVGGPKGTAQRGRSRGKDLEIQIFERFFIVRRSHMIAI